uniref:Uncharacterized protein n=1 Tax=Rhizophora mucronata TaxID=61149 RepID=A0A2P2PYR1_RHIMU
MGLSQISDFFFLLLFFFFNVSMSIPIYKWRNFSTRREINHVSESNIIN